MRVTVDVKGEGEHAVDLADLGPRSAGAASDADVSPADANVDASPADADGPPTYADLLAAVDVSPHEVTVLVDGRPVPEDQPVAAERVTVLRMIKGG